MLLFLSILSVLSSFQMKAFANTIPSQESMKKDQIVDCQNLYKNHIKQYVRLSQFLSPSEQRKPQLKPLRFLSQANHQSCQSYSFYKLLVHFLESHSKKAIALLPLSGLHQPLGQTAAMAMKEHFIENFNIDFKVLDTMSHAHRFHKELAKAVFFDRPAMLIGGINKNEAALISYWSKALRIPSLILHDRYSKTTSPNTFNVSPSQENLGQTLAAYIISRSYRRVAIIAKEKQLNPFEKSLMKELENRHVSTKILRGYKARNYEAREKILKTFFKIVPEGREEEYQELLETKREASLKAGLPFQADSIQLKPIVDVDAIVFPFNFKELKHFARILRYLGVPKIPLLGNQTWRAPELFEPTDSYLVGAVFVDFLGSYLELPYLPPISHEVSGYLDYKVISKHAAQITGLTLKKKSTLRSQIVSDLRSLKSHQTDPFYGSKSVFNQKQQTSWPSFLYSLTDRSYLKLFKRSADISKALQSRQQAY